MTMMPQLTEMTFSELRRYDEIWAQVFEELEGRPYDGNMSYRVRHGMDVSDITAEAQRRFLSEAT